MSETNPVCDPLAAQARDVVTAIDELSRRLSELEAWRRGVEAELGEQDDIDLGGAVLEDHERQAEAEEREALIRDLETWKRSDRPLPTCRDILDRHLGPVPRPLTPAEVEACRLAAVEDGPSRPPPAIVPGERPFGVRLDAAGPVAIVNARGWDVIHLHPSRLTASNVDAIVAILNRVPSEVGTHEPADGNPPDGVPVLVAGGRAMRNGGAWWSLESDPPRPIAWAVTWWRFPDGETPLQKLARQVADSAATSVMELQRSGLSERWARENERSLDLLRRWIDASGFALKAEGEG